MRILIRCVLTILATSAYLLLAVLGWDGFAAFFFHPAFVALTIVTLVIAVIALFVGGNVSPGIREDRSNRWVLVVFTVTGFALGFVPAYTDRIGFWTLDGEGLRWIGLVIFVVGCVLRLVPVYVLGNRFSGLVAIQPGHTLVTTGIYSQVRNPSYLGALILIVGWALVFRSVVGLLMILIFLPTLIARMKSEEKLLRSQFGAEYEAYFARTWRLVPHLY